LDLDLEAARRKIGQLPDAAVGALSRTLKYRAGTGLVRVEDVAEESVHPYMTEILAAERVKGWQQQAEQARLVNRARRARLMPYAARLALLRGRHVRAARPVAGTPGVGDGRPATADERQPESTRAA
jgi:hypothetical protein